MDIRGISLIHWASGTGNVCGVKASIPYFGEWMKPFNDELLGMVHQYFTGRRQVRNRRTLDVVGI